ncbi:hypothetical protein CVU37_15120, partial [candidate division BRC1 bacterium HGW-BRC1-1]
MLSMSAELAARLAAAVDDGCDVAAVVKIEWPLPVGDRWFSTRRMTLGGGVVCEPKLMEWPAIVKAGVPTVLVPEALNESVTIKLLNTPETWDGAEDAARLMDLVAQAPLEGALVWVGIVDPRDAALGVGQVKWDNCYKVDHVERSAQVVEIYATDILLQPGEGPAAWPISGSEFDEAPEESLGQVRGAVWGKVEGLPLIPIDVGRGAALAGEVDEAEDEFEVSCSLEGWPSVGWAWVDGEMIYYAGMDRAGKRLTMVQRGVGWPDTTPVAHEAGARVREARTGFVSKLKVALDAVATTCTIEEVAGFPASGTVIIGTEAISYATKGVGSLAGCVRGRPIPTFAATHNAGAIVREVPTRDGLQRYRYLVAAAPVSGISNIRGLDENNNEVPVEIGVVELGTFTTPKGKVWSVVDLSERVTLTKFAQSVSTVPQEWVKETDGRVDAVTGFALPDGFKRWTVTSVTSAALKLQAPLVLDPTSGSQAAFLKAMAGQNVMGLEFDAGWDAGLEPRVVAGRFKTARVVVQAQYNKETTTKAWIEIVKGGVPVKSVAVAA